MRDGVEAPPQRASADIEGSDIARRRGVSLRIAATDDDEVLVNEAGGREGDGVLCVVAPQILAKIDSAIFGKVRDGFTGGGVKSVQVIQDPGEDAGMGAIGPVREAARRLAVFEAGIEGPDLLAGSRIEGNDFAGKCAGVQHAANDEGVGFEIALFARVELPRNFELGHVGAIDLRKR